MFDAVMAVASEVQGSPDDTASVATDVPGSRDLDLAGVPEKIIPPAKAFEIIAWLRDRPREICHELRRIAKEVLGGKDVGLTQSFEAYGENLEEQEDVVLIKEKDQEDQYV
jgi:hypothetical protein